jgi:Ca2+-transporting ATPase
MKNEWHSQEITDVFATLGTTERGLELVEVVRRLKQYGDNALPVAKPLSAWDIFLAQFKSPLIYILLIASVVVFFLGDITDTIVIIAVLLVNAVIGVVQEGKAQNTLAALQRFTKTEAVVIRNGVEESVTDKEVVPGDIIVLREGDKVPADGRIFESKNLQIDEAALTGESLPVAKQAGVVGATLTNPADQTNMVFRGSLVVAGSARAVVVATGVGTIIGKISQKITTLETDVPLTKNIERLSKYIGLGVLVVSAGVFGLGVLYGNSMHEMFFTAVAVAVSLVPEGLPVVITLVLSTGAYRMARQMALVKKLGAVEALGQANIIAVDKTGTITKNELMVEQVYIDGKTYSVQGNGYESKGDIMLDGAVVEAVNHADILFAGKIATFCASAQVVFREKEGVWKITGDPTEAALLVFGEKTGFHKDELEQEEVLLNDQPFDSKLKYHATLHTVRHKPFLSVVGAPESVIEISDKYWQSGRAKKMTNDVREHIEHTVRTMSQAGLRVIAFSYAPNYTDELGLTPLHGLTFGGLFAMRDVLREGVRQSVEAAFQSGLRTVMITGDHKLTAQTIARDAGIFHDGDDIITGTELTTLSKEELMVRLPHVSVFARVTPEHKLDIIELFRKRGDIIAMTGDGVNDALSLVAADLGIAMGKIGTEVSKEAADIVLLDDNFNSIVLAIEEGRNIYKSIKKVIHYLFSTGLGELFSIVGAMLLFLPPPVFPTQILWLNLVTDGFLVAALAFEPKEKLNSRIVQGGNKYFFDRLSIIRMIIMSVVMAGATLFVFQHYFSLGAAQSYTMALTVLAALQWWNAWNVRSETESIFSSKVKLFSNPYLIAATVAVIMLQLVAIYHPVAQTLLKTVDLTARELLIAVVISFVIVLVEEARKWGMRLYDRRKHAHV